MMFELADVRCTQPAHGFKAGNCDGLLFRVSSTGGLEVKCHRCHDIHMVHRWQIDRHVTTDRLAFQLEE